MKQKKNIRAKVYIGKHEATECIRAEIAQAIEGSSLSEGAELARAFLSRTSDIDSTEEILQQGFKFNVLFY